MICTKVFSTEVALTWWFLGMYLYMYFKTTNLWERLITFTALMWFLSSKIQLMVFKMTIVYKCPIAMMTLIWSLTSANPHVANKMAILWKSFSTLKTLICFLPCMYLHMSCKKLVMCKSLVTLVAFKWSFPSMYGILLSECNCNAFKESFKISELFKRSKFAVSPVWLKLWTVLSHLVCEVTLLNSYFGQILYSRSYD